jgi:hypothetical protein
MDIDTETVPASGDLDALQFTDEVERGPRRPRPPMLRDPMFWAGAGVVVGGIMFFATRKQVQCPDCAHRIAEAAQAAQAQPARGARGGGGPAAGADAEVHPIRPQMPPPQARVGVGLAVPVFPANPDVMPGEPYFPPADPVYTEPDLEPAGDPAYAEQLEQLQAVDPVDELEALDAALSSMAHPAGPDPVAAAPRRRRPVKSAASVDHNPTV